MNELDAHIINYLKSTGRYKEGKSDTALKYVSELDKKILFTRTAPNKKNTLQSIGESLGISKQAVHSRVTRILKFFDNL